MDATHATAATLSRPWRVEWFWPGEPGYLYRPWRPVQTAGRLRRRLRVNPNQWVRGPVRLAVPPYDTTEDSVRLVVVSSPLQLVGRHLRFRSSRHLGRQEGRPPRAGSRPGWAIRTSALGPSSRPVELVHRQRRLMKPSPGDCNCNGRSVGPGGVDVLQRNTRIHAPLPKPHSCMRRTAPVSRGLCPCVSESHYSSQKRPGSPCPPRRPTPAP